MIITTIMVTIFINLYFIILIIITTIPIIMVNLKISQKNSFILIVFD